jgi:hypothetical protein
LTFRCRPSPHWIPGSLHLPANCREYTTNRRVRSDHADGWFRRNPDPTVPPPSSSPGRHALEEGLFLKRMTFSRGGRFRPGLLFAGRSAVLGSAWTGSPFADPSAGRPTGSGINPDYAVACVKEDWVTTYLTGDPTQGICFFTKRFPGLK